MADLDARLAAQMDMYDFKPKPLCARTNKLALSEKKDMSPSLRNENR